MGRAMLQTTLQASGRATGTDELLCSQWHWRLTDVSLLNLTAIRKQLFSCLELPQPNAVECMQLI